MSKLLFVRSMLLASMALRADAYCSLRVKVVSPSGEEVETRVVVEEENGWKTERMSRRGAAEFCGLGIKRVSVTIGAAGCNQVVVRDVPLKWNETRILSVTYDEGPCQGETLPVAACAFLLRFVDSNHRPIGGVSFKEQKPFAGSHQGDDYGRIFIEIAAWQQLLGIGSADGYEPAQVSVPCISENYRLERVVVLKRTGQ